MEYFSTRKLPGARPLSLNINGIEFTFVTQQRDRKSAIYKSPDAYLRIGEVSKIKKDLDLHMQMEQARFPVAKVLAQGEHEEEAYFIETSLGNEHFGELFAHDVEEKGVISDSTFEQFVAIAEEFARAQMHARSAGAPDDFSSGILLNELCDEMPEYRDALRRHFEEVCERMSSLPFVVTHGDFNPNNLYPKGVIDLEDSFNAPFGYDLLGAVAHIDSFPDSDEYEYFAKYRFTSEQIKHYVERLDAISKEAGLPPFSQFWDDFDFCRSVWLAAEIPTTPKLQKFRFERLVRKFLADAV